MTVTVKLFAAARDLIGSTSIELELPVGSTFVELKSALIEMFPHAAGLLSRSLIARNQDYAVEADVIVASDELAIIPPVSGG